MTAETKLLLIIHAAATFFMLGVIVLIQLVHYPLFRYVGAETYTTYQSAHMSAITLVVGPAMLIEALTGFLLLTNVDLPPALVWIGLALIGVVWLTTAFVNVPQHSQLSIGFNAAVHQALVASNWIRTLAWAGRGAVVALMLWASLR